MENVVEELVPDPFIKIKIEYISESVVWNIIQFVFIVFQSEGLPKYIKTKVLTTDHFTLYKAFLRKKNSLELVSLSYFRHDFQQKIISYVIFYQMTKFQCLLVFT